MNHETLPSAGVLTEIIDPEGLFETPQVAKVILSLHLKPEAKDRIRELLQKNIAGTITPDEQRTLDEYIVTGELLDLLQAKARRTLRESGSAVP